MNNTTTYPNQNVGGTYQGRLHELDFGAHVHLLEEWNETPFVWGDATATELGADVLVTHPFRTASMTGVAVARYVALGEGDLLELKVESDQGCESLVYRKR